MNWQHQLPENLEELAFTTGRHNNGVIHKTSRDVSVLVHGDHVPARKTRNK